MKKWSFLVASLLLMGATATTFTSCVDTDEPEGILEMRKAKAEYIRALAAVENAKIAYQQAAAQNEQANAELLKAQAQAEILKAQIAADQAKIANECAVKIAEAQAQAELLRAEGEKNLNDAKAQIALAEAEKILAEAMDEKARTEQLIAENEIKLQEMKAKLEVVLQKCQTEMVLAQAQYELALKDIAALDLVLSPVESNILTAAKTAYTDAYAKLKLKAKAVSDAQKDLLDQMYANEDAAAQLEHKLADDKSKLAAMKATLAELEKLAADVTPTAWETRRDSLAKIIASEQLMKDELSLKIEEVKQSAEYKAAAAKDAADLKAYIQAQQYYNYLSAETTLDCKAEYNSAAKSYGKMGDESTHDAAAFKEVDAAKTYTTNKKDIEIPVKKSLRKKLYNDEDKTAIVVAALTNKDWNDTKKQKWDNALEKMVDNNATYKALVEWKAAADKITVTPEEIAKDTCKFDDEVVAKTTAHTAAVDMFNKMHQQYQTGEIVDVVKTDKVLAAVDKYNEAFGKLAQAVKDYNEEVDKVYNAKLAEAKKAKETAKKAELLKTEINKHTNAMTTYVDGQVTSEHTYAEVEKLIDAWYVLNPTTLESDTKYKDAATAKKTLAADVDKEFKDLKPSQITAMYEGTEDTAKTGVVSALADDKTDLYKKNAAIATAQKSADGKEGVFPMRDKLAEALDHTDSDETKWGYKQTAAKYSQVLDNDKAAELLVLAGFYKVENNALTPTTHNVEGAKENNGAANVSDTYVVDEVKLNAAGNAYEKVYKHKTLVVAAIDKTVATNALKLKVDKDNIKTAWENASKTAFGEIRHTELKEDMLVDNKTTSTNAVAKNEQKQNIAELGTSTLGALLKAKAAVQEHKDFATIKEDAAALSAAIQVKIDEVTKLIDGWQKEIDDAKEAIKPVKAAHQASHKAAQKLVDACGSETDITNIITDLGTLKTKLNNILNAYYADALYELKYTDENGNEQKVLWTKGNNDSQREFSDIKAWIESVIKTYTKKDPAMGTKDTHGKIADQEAKVANLEKLVSRYEENGYTGKDAELTAAINDFVLVPLQETLEQAQYEYDYLLKELSNAEANLNKVLEALGNGIALKDTEYPKAPSIIGSGAQGGASSDPALNDKVTIQL